jgi:hypothetical protein
VAWELGSIAQPTTFSPTDVEDEVARATVKATGGTFTLTAEGSTTGPIAFNAPASESEGPGSVEAALNALPGLEGVATVTGGPGDGEGEHPYLIAVAGRLAGQNIASLTASSASLTGSEHEVTLGVPSKGRFTDLYVLTLTNVGSRSSTGPITLVDHLPAGVTAAETPTQSEKGNVGWECTPGAGHEVIVCTTEGVVPTLTPTTAIFLRVEVAQSAPDTLVNQVEVSGGAAATASTAETVTSVGAPVPSFEPLGFGASSLDPAGVFDTQSASHPATVVTNFAFPTANVPIVSVSGGEVAALPVGEVKQIVVDLPPGFVGDAQVTPTCSPIELADFGRCPAATQVGTLTLITPNNVQALETNLKIFNITPEQGYPAEFGVYDPNVQRSALMYASLVGSGAATHVRVVSQPLPQAIPTVGVSATFFGNPVAQDASPLTAAAFFTNPSDCTASGFTTTLYADSWQHPGRVEQDGQADLSDTADWKKATSVSPPVTGCEALQFRPGLSLAPEEAHSQADEPSGYETVLGVPQSEAPNEFATPSLKTSVVTLPAGVAISPAAADGLVGCQEAGAEGIELGTDHSGHCPAASTIGKVEVFTPLLKEPLSGSVFVAQPGCSPCSEAQAEKGEVFALYLEVGNENSGVHIKLRGEVEVGGAGHNNDLALGQVRATFAQTPQDPFSELKLSFNGGPRAPLANPQTCAGFTSVAELEPWSHAPAPGEAQGTPDVTLTPSFNVTGCENGFSPAFTAGTTNPRAGGYSPFSVTFSRQDREQDLAGITVGLPEGLLGKIAGLAQCPEAQANTGLCSAASRVGTATAAAGSGSHPFWQSGAVYLTGPYKGAPFGLSVVVPAVAGPFNLGAIVVRAAIYIDPRTAQVTVVSDPLPQSVDGVPLRIKTVNVTVGGERDFTFNPTNCTAASVDATLTSTQGARAGVSSHYQPADCASLPFKPSFKASTAGSTSKARGASLTVTVVPAAGQANIAKVSLELPRQLPARLTTLQKACTEAQFNTNPAGCPAASDIGFAKAVTPVLNSPLVGPAYLVSHGGAAFPDVEFILQGEGVTIDLDGATQIKKGITYSHFETVPDAPISSFETTLPEGPHSVLATDIPAKAKSSLCGLAVNMPTTITGQNGAIVTQSTKLTVSGCAKVKALTRAQKLAAALKSCHKQKRAKRAGCERGARKRYGSPARSKSKHPAKKG